LLTPLKAARILVVEDNDLLRGQLASLLKEKGCEVEEAGSGNTALARIENVQFDVILLDLMLSKNQADVQGVDFLRRLNASGSNTPVIVITNKASNQAIQDSFETGAGNVYAFLLKSLITPENIIQLIENAIRFPHLTTDASKYLTGNHDIHLIRGIRSDLHYSVKQYIEYFDDFLKKFKGENVDVSMFSFLDDIFVEFKSYKDRNKVMQWFQEFLQYPLQYPTFVPKFETPVSAMEGQVLRADFENQVRTFTSEIARHFYGAFRDCVTIPVQETTTSVFEINGLKIFNNYTLHSTLPSPLFRDFRLMEKISQRAVSEGNTLEALENVLDFCARYNLAHTKRKALLLMGRFNQAQENRRRAILSTDVFRAEIDAINGDILLNLVIDIERELGFNKQ